MYKRFACLASFLFSAVPVLAQPSVRVGDIACIPVGENAVATAVLTDEAPGNTVRLYFSRLHNEVEDFYYVEMRPSGGGQYWAILPQPEDKAIERTQLRRRQGERETGTEWAEWWREKERSDKRDPNDDLDEKVIKEQASVGKKEPRAWIRNQPDPDLQRWLERQRYEPAQYYAAIYDGAGRFVSKSDVKVTPVNKDCRVQLTPVQAGYAENLTIGETADWQRGERVFHWECDGIVTRIDPVGIPRADESCRACLIAWWKPAAVVGAGAVTGIIVERFDPEPVSPSQPIE